MKTRLSILFFAMLLLGGNAWAAISSSPVTKDATEGATLLYKFLSDNYGKKTISGVMTGDQAGPTLATAYEYVAVNKKSGKNPAMVGFDFLMATGAQSDESWFKTYTANEISRATELWKEGGIPAFCWHWKVDQDTAFYAIGANGGKGETEFDFTKAFKSGTTEWNTSSATYKALVADIDKVSKHFLNLQEHGVAAIWRPLHEAAGGWFWWGCRGAEAYKALYRLVYDRMVNVNGLKNLIWTWNIERDPAIGYDYKALNGKWYPGDDVVDVIGVDIYNSAYDYKSNADSYKKIISEMGNNKILALTENGPIVDPKNMANDGAVWSWWMPWYESPLMGGNYVSQTSEDEWKSAMASDAIITLDEMPGWGTYQEVEDPACAISRARGIFEVECSSDYEAAIEMVSQKSGSSALNLKESTDYVNVTVTAKTKGSYKVYVGYNTIFGFKQIDCAVNGVSGVANLGESQTIAQEDKRGETLVGTFELAAGDNTVRLTPIWTWAVVDYVRIELDEDAPVYEFTTSDVDGFKVSGSKLLDRCDNEFVMRGVNLAYTWYKTSAYDQLKAIKDAGANTVRIVLTNGKAYGSPADDATAVKQLVDACKEYGMLAIIEVHDVTGSDQISDLESAAQYFVDIASVLKGTESYVMINIANEWHNSSSPTNWRDGYVKAIPMIREAGLRHCIMVDAGGYGQSAATIHTYGKDVLAADEDNNVIFSIHMYGTAGNSAKVKSNIDGVINQDLALCIGEFGWYHSDGDVDEDLILSYCQEKNVGWLAWSWYGNGSSVQYLDLVKDASANPVLAEQSAEGQSCKWGEKIVNAWKEEAKMPVLETCGTNVVNEIASYGQSDLLYFVKDAGLLYVDSEKGGYLQVLNMGANVVMTDYVMSQKSTIDLHSLPSGAYIVVLNDAVLKFTK